MSKPLTPQPTGPLTFREFLKVVPLLLGVLLSLILTVVGLFIGPWNPLHLSGDVWWFLTILIFVCWLIDRNENQRRSR